MSLQLAPPVAYIQCVRRFAEVTYIRFMSVHVVGIDCACDPRNVGLAFGVFDGDLVRIGAVARGSKAASPAKIVSGWIEGLSNPVLIALDAPLGWPAPLAHSLARHVAGARLDVEAHALFRRATDRFVREHTDQQSLDVGADRIARTAHAALSLLEDLRRVTGMGIPLAWDQQLTACSAVEVYPAATLRVHGVNPKGYKGVTGSAVRETYLAKLGTLLHLPRELKPLVANADVFDAVVCLLAAQDFLRAECYDPPDPDVAQQEGWIWVRDRSASKGL
jgi:hypothetical protein